MNDIHAFFKENGYAILRSAFSGDQLEQLCARGHALRDRADRELPDGVRYVDKMHQDADHSWGVNEITRPGWFDPVLVNAIAAPALLGALHDLLGAPRAWGQKMLWAPRGAEYKLHWHRDIDHKYDALMPFKDDRNDHVQFNGALEEDDSFVVVPKSHRRPILPEEIEALGAEHRGDLPGQVRVHLRPGDVVMMDAHALHRGSARAGAPRLSLHFSFQADWVPLRPWGTPSDFAWIQSDAFIEQLHEDVRPMYLRLRDAERLGEADNHMAWLEQQASSNGFAGELVSPWPPRGM